MGAARGFFGARLADCVTNVEPIRDWFEVAEVVAVCDSSLLFDLKLALVVESILREGVFTLAG